MTAYVYDDTLTVLPIHHSAGLHWNGWREELVAECREVQARVRMLVEADCAEDWL